jgi:hypothetical protein
MEAFTMAKSKTRKRSAGKSAAANPFRLRRPAETAQEVKELVHVIKKGIRCDTDARGHPTPRGRTPLSIVVDASEGFIPLWAKQSTLRWRFRESSFQSFASPDAAKAETERLLGEALLKWGDAAPVKFAKRTDAWDFEIVMKKSDDCDISGCVLASAFFPDAGRHQLILYPKMFEQTKKEQVETLIHEIGHVFGLRHFFAKLSEGAWPSQIFGRHRKFTIMNYGEHSVLTSADKSDLRKLYRMAWSGQLRQINGTPIKFVRPFHAAGDTPDVVAVGEIQTLVEAPRRRRRR